MKVLDIIRNLLKQIYYCIRLCILLYQIYINHRNIHDKYKW